MERHPLDHVNRLARQQRALRARRRAFAVADGEADLRSRRRLREGKGDEFLETDGAGADNMLAGVHQDMDRRSEEHTSELQSLMRISYAVFCLKKKNYTRLLE